MRKRVIGMERWYLAPFGVVGGRGRRERALGRGGAAASGFDHGGGFWSRSFSGRMRKTQFMNKNDGGRSCICCEGL